MAKKPTWEPWREAIAGGGVAGCVWKEPHLQNEHQMIDDKCVGVSVGNQHGSVWVYAYPDKIVVVFYAGKSAGGKEVRREEYAVAPVLTTA